MKENEDMKAKRLKELISQIPDDVEIVLDDLYGNGWMEIDEQIEEDYIPYLDSTTEVEGWESQNAYVISFKDLSIREV
jgi:hypothetical protein